MSDNTESRHVGIVKWFNNKAGYGFITALDGDLKDKDIFVHYSTISVVNPQYKYLVQGEYLEFDLVKSQNDKHEYQATNVSGVKGGSIMCETRQSYRPKDLGETSRPTRVSHPDSRVPQDRKRSQDKLDNDGFTTVDNKKRSYKKKPTKEVRV
jgi:CspA family cold shock protein